QAVRHKPVLKPVLEPFCLCRLSGRNGGQFTVFVNPFSSFPKFLSFRYSQSSGELAPWCLDLYAAGAIAPDHNPDSWWPGVCLKRVTKLQLGV
ncbi:hypothetical protein, partial [Agrobacterium tumefaciens]|uniref:hypothetical protein n=1 Tax=Agrobacterium tumefaciens TaxID=358 RepID=UPI002AFDE764